MPRPTARLQHVGGARVELALHQPVHQMHDGHFAPALASP